MKMATRFCLVVELVAEEEALMALAGVRSLICRCLTNWGEQQGFSLS